MSDNTSLWQRYCDLLCTDPSTGSALDLSRVRFGDDFLSSMEPRMQAALEAMQKLESGAIANPDEDRMVGHYWLRSPSLAPDDETRQQITQSVTDIKAFAADVADGKLAGSAGPFKHLLHIGIGGSALGPQFISHALGAGGLESHFIDNTDPAGIDHTLAALEGQLGQTLVTVVSKSGGTPEPRNGMLETMEAYRRAGVPFNADIRQNPAALLALAWYQLTDGRGAKDMVILPYCDRLLLFSRYLQQLVMESLGKRLDRQGREVHQGIAVYGNKGSTDQHAYVQQLRDGVNNFFVTFVEVLEDRQGPSIEVEPGITAGDYLCGFLQGTRQALYESGRDSVTITIDHVDAHRVGALIALYERAVGLYAELVDINAYHQPGVEAGKKAAAAVLELQQAVVAQLAKADGPQTAVALAKQIGKSDEVETVYKVLRHLAANPGRGVKVASQAGPSETTFTTA